MGIDASIVLAVFYYLFIVQLLWTPKVHIMVYIAVWRILVM